MFICAITIIRTPSYGMVLFGRFTHTLIRGGVPFCVKIAHFSRIRTRIPVVSGQYNGISGHLAEDYQITGTLVAEFAKGAGILGGSTP
ncbi:hypothetical protein SCFA_2960002 [anaerobic digester metagenome]|uniref:Uncharacterized protein n=1 Tax=anaerobic digester metagenome TaxID=1263854 RepID=A0A485M2A7_9ZZZZ